MKMVATPGRRLGLGVSRKLGGFGRQTRRFGVRGDLDENKKPKKTTREEAV